MKSQKFSFKKGDTTVEFVVHLTQNKHGMYGLVTILQADGGSLDIDEMPVHTFGEVYRWVQEHNDYML